jgi:phosphoenolpyruvate carboxykinase (GTP)
MHKFNTDLGLWVKEISQLTCAAKIHWCTGTQEEYQSLTKAMVENKQLTKLNITTHPNCFLHLSNPNDVARTEHLTFVCTKEKQDVGPNNNWIDEDKANLQIRELFKNSMKNRTMYVIPYCMGPLKSPYSRLGVQITDSPYVVINMKHMTRMGDAAHKAIKAGKTFVRGLHGLGDLSLEKRRIMHFPNQDMIASFSSGYGGNALLGKKCHALRIASWQAKQEGWLAEHMLIVGLENPQGEKHYIAAAFPSACGKTNLAMLIPPKTYTGWKIWTVGDDIAWMHPGEDGRLYAINPEAGFFGVAPGTSKNTNPNALKMLGKNSIFTNVATTKDKQPWWEGKDTQTPAYNWRGEAYQKDSGSAAHPNSRFTVSMQQCPSYSDEAENPNGVPISAIIFGGRRPQTIPLVYQAKDWNHGVLMGASMCSQTTAAATGQVGVLRHDPMAMKPFCGYHYGDYWKHWLEMGKKIKNPPKIFHVNWFRKNTENKFLWPGFGENIRVLEWIIKRTNGTATANTTPIGHTPKLSSLCTDGLDIDEKTLKELTQVTPEGWTQELENTRSYLEQFDPRVPQELKDELQKIKNSLLV